MLPTDDCALLAKALLKSCVSLPFLWGIYRPLHGLEVNVAQVFKLDTWQLEDGKLTKLTLRIL